MVGVGIPRSALASRVAAALTRRSRPARPPATVGKPPDQGAGHPLRQQEDARRPAEEDGARAARHRGRDYVPIIRDPKATRHETGGGVLFPGCGSERLFARWAWPRRRCSGTSARRRCCRRATCAAATRSAAPATTTREQMITDNRVLFHRVANTLNYLDIKTVVVVRHLHTTSCRATSSTRSSPAAASSTSTSTCWKRHHAARVKVTLHVPRPRHTPMKLAGSDEDGREGAVGRRSRQVRAVLRRVGHARVVTRPTSRRRSASARKKRSATVESTLRPRAPRAT